MSSDIPAFPHTHEEEYGDNGHTRTVTQGGMSLLDYFAAKALPSVWSDAPDGSFSGIAIAAYSMASAMLAERERLMEEERRIRENRCAHCNMPYRQHRGHCPQVPRVLVACAACAKPIHADSVVCRDGDQDEQWVHTLTCTI